MLQYLYGAEEKRFLERYGGYVLAILVIAVWLSTQVGPLFILIASVVTSLYFFFVAPLWCQAINRDGKTLCRKNSRGLLLGCSYCQHKWQKLSFKIFTHGGRRVREILFGETANAVASITAILVLVSAAVALTKEIIA